MDSIDSLSFHPFSQTVVAFFSALARVFPAMTTLGCLIGGRAWKSVVFLLSVTYAFVLTPWVAVDSRLPMALLPIFARVLKELVVGMGCALFMVVPLAGVLGAGSLVQRVLTASSSANTAASDQDMAQRLYLVIALGAFAWVNGPTLWLTAWTESFSSLSLTTTLQRDWSWVKLAAYAAQDVVRFALLTASPVVMTLVLVDLALGFIRRAFPELPHWGLGLSMRYALTVLLIAWSVPHVLDSTQQRIQKSARHTAQDQFFK